MYVERARSIVPLCPEPGRTLLSEALNEIIILNLTIEQKDAVIATLSGEVSSSNELLRSSKAIAERERTNRQTNWTSFIDRLNVRLKVQHEILHGGKNDKAAS